MSDVIDTIGSSENDVFGGTAGHTQLFTLLASQSCRYLIYYFSVVSTPDALLEDLVTGIQTLAAQKSDSPVLVNDHQLRALLVQTTIPKLERCDILEYDSQSTVVHYHRQPFVEEYAEHAAYQELTTDFVTSQLY